MEILREYGINGDKRLRYNMLEGHGENLADRIGQRFGVKAYILVQDVNGDGEPIKNLKIMDEDGKVVGTSSKSFIEGFERFLVCMESDACEELEVSASKSRNGRNYLTFKA